MEDATAGDAFQFSDNREGHRFELHVGGELAAFAEYNLLKTGVLFTHTEVLQAFEGRGIGSAIARYALDEVRRRSLLAMPACPFIAGFLRKHPQYHDLVSPESRRAYRI
ncbi:GNAT family N-acetyltransferase [Ramlibacter tataouinensis]|uniref:GNAT family N-acetyltransferase n=1 Tax=Ramlibacter tataouinensis TaxID=94132 RepID=UPI0022F3A3F5|nr:GNAT family N-acetyltransferase [Ramlibacter tataouinensis]WBY02887.1 GNAT family N-acetyltransferase [Ramlibacter tataouinensis]